jgi:hypothetical protein
MNAAHPYPVLASAVAEGPDLPVAAWLVLALVFVVAGASAAVRYARPSSKE